MEGEIFRINKVQLCLGILLLIAGAMVYLVDRPIGSVLLLSHYASIHHFFQHIPNLYGQVGMFAPEFFHPLALSLISMALLEKKRSKSISCFVWFFVNSMFEFGQQFNADLLTQIPAWFVSTPIIQDFVYFFINGTFDSYDLVAIGLGSLTALLILQFESRREGTNE